MRGLRQLSALVLAAAVALAISIMAFAGTAQNVAVTAGKPSELKFTLSKKTVNRGQVVFTLTNRGALEHDFKIAGKKTATIGKGKSTKLTVRFTKAGKYPFICTVAGHAAGGMKGTLTVK